MKFAFWFVWMLAIAASADFKSRFGAFEHRMAGDDIKLIGIGKKLTLSNGLEMTFGDMVAMADFHGVYGASISLGRHPESQIDRFLDIFRTLDESPRALVEVPQILASLKNDQSLVQTGMASGHCPHEIYDAGGKERVRNWNCITGGGCSGPWFLMPGRFMWLAKENFDHFGANAIAAYKAGHLAALREAASGNLERAYAMDGFACHYLTDRFASGHIRVPRYELSRMVTPASAGDMISGFMHNEEGELGLHVHNKRGDKWMAYGDGRYLEEENAQNRAIMREALQRSVTEVYDAYENKNSETEFSALELIPEADGVGNITPMFVYDFRTDTILRRSKLKEPEDKQMTAHWWGWSTLAELKLVKGLPSDHYD